MRHDCLHVAFLLPAQVIASHPSTLFCVLLPHFSYEPNLKSLQAWNGDIGSYLWCFVYMDMKFDRFHMQSFKICVCECRACKHFCVGQSPLHLISRFAYTNSQWNQWVVIASVWLLHEQVAFKLHGYGSAVSSSFHSFLKLCKATCLWVCCLKTLVCWFAWSVP